MKQYKVVKVNPQTATDDLEKSLNWWAKQGYVFKQALQGFRYDNKQTTTMFVIMEKEDE